MPVLVMRLWWFAQRPRLLDIEPIAQPSQISSHCVQDIWMLATAAPQLWLRQVLALLRITGAAAAVFKLLLPQPAYACSCACVLY